MNRNDFNFSDNIEAAVQKIAPTWSLENMVAVNPYMGMSNHSFSSAANMYKKMAGVDLLMPKEFYVEAIKNSKILDVDLRASLIKNGHESISVEDFKTTLDSRDSKERRISYSIKTVAEVAGDLTEKNWHSFVLDRISNWASSYFDKGQAFWKTANQHNCIFEAWKANALVDKSPKIMGLKNFKQILLNTPNNQKEAIERAIIGLGLSSKNIDTYLHALLLKFGGWSAYIRGLDWDEGLYGGEKNNLESFAAVLLTWEFCLLNTFKDQEPALDAHWKHNLEKIASAENMKQFDRELAINLILQDALDLSRERELINQFAKTNSETKHQKRPLAQAVFCIDVRSEVYRRQLEHANQDIETIGFAGFFGFPIRFKGLGQDKGQNQCPALIPSGPIVREILPNANDQAEAAKKRINLFQIEKHWKRFKTGAISGFSFVSPMGLLYVFKLLSDSLRITRATTRASEIGLSKKTLSEKIVDVSGIPLDEQVAMAKGALTGMGLTKNFAPVVLIIGHGSDTVNNPHATGLDCGACGGHSGESNAMTAEAVLNNPKVRDILSKSGIAIPEDTHFVAALHNTTTDKISILNEQLVPKGHQTYLLEVKMSLAVASSATRHERATKLNIGESANKDKAVIARSKDWSTVRPEWGLAGCSAFIIAPRHRTSKMSLDGKSFLHNYDWKNDQELNILESIMTAPMVVTSWINLQYFASTVDNKNFGSGNKTLHNVTGGFGVIEGGAGDLRIGLAMQSVHDGKKYQHIPNRLNVIIEAPIEAINKILEKHENVRILFDNDWINLLSINNEGKINKRYTNHLNWETIKEEHSIKELTKEVKYEVEA